MPGPKASAARAPFPADLSVGGTEPDTGASAFKNLIGSSGLLYRPIRELGAGGMAHVFLAYGHGSSGFSKLVVLKVMRQRLEDTTFRTMFLEEARLSARLNHPNLVQVYEVVDTGDVPYMVMEYLEGKPLSAFHTKGVLDEAAALTVISEALIGLHHAHELVDYDGKLLNLVHRDVSPHNIFVTYDGAVKILDFGIAKTDAAPTHTQAGEVKGKLAYMSPEQLFGDKLDRRADVFAMGVILWETAVGAPLWDNVAQAQLMHRLATGSLPRPSERATVDPDLEEIIVRAMAAEPDQRFSSALEMHQALREYCLKKGRLVSPREVGNALATRFAKDREEERRVVSAALRESLGPPAQELGAREGGLDASAGARRSALLRLGGAVVAAFVVGFGLLYSLDFFKASPPAAAEAVPTKPEPKQVVQLELRVEPREASIELDGKAIGKGSLHLEVPRDEQEHQLVLSAPGFVSVRRVLKFDRSHDLGVVLTAEPKTPEAKEPTESAAGNQAPATRSNPKAAHRAETPAQKRTPAPPASQPPVRTSENSCDPPYYFKGGIKTYRPECL